MLYKLCIICILVYANDEHDRIPALHRPPPLAGEAPLHTCTRLPDPAPLYSNFHSGGTAMAQLNLSRSVLGKTLSTGTSWRLHQATEMRGSM